MGAENYNHQSDKLTEIIELSQELDCCDENLGTAYWNATNLDICWRERKEYWNRFWDYLAESLELFSSIRKMPITALLGYAEILEHDKDCLKSPKNDDEFYLYGNLDARHHQIRQIIERSR